DGGQAVDLETDFSPDVPQEFDIPGPLMAKGKVISDTDAVNLAKPGGEIANELVAGSAAEGRVELDEKDGIHPQGFNGPKLLRERVDELRSPVGATIELG